MVLEATILTLILAFSYIGIFITSIIVSLPTMIPLPAYLIIVGSVALNLNPILAAFIVGFGSMIGEIVSYNIGIVGGNVARKKLRRYMGVEKKIENYFDRFGFLTIFLTAFFFFPFIVVSIIAGMHKYDIKKYLLAGFIGKVLKTWILIKLTIIGFSYINFLLI